MLGTRKVAESVCGTLGLHGNFFATGVAGVIKERNWLSESNVELNLAVVLLDLNIADSLTDIVEILRAFDDILNQIRSLEEAVPAAFLPEVEEIVLEELHVAH